MPRIRFQHEGRSRRANQTLGTRLPRAGRRLPGAPEAGKKWPAPEAGWKHPSPETGFRNPAPEAGFRFPAPEAGCRSPFAAYRPGAPVA